jgi:hypothetical protein
VGESLWARHNQFDSWGWAEHPIVRATAKRVWIAADGGRDLAFDLDKLALARRQRSPHGERRGDWAYYDAEGKARWERDHAAMEVALAERLGALS